MRLRLALVGAVAATAALTAVPAAAPAAAPAAPAADTVLSVSDPRGDVQGPRAALRKQRLVDAADLSHYSIGVVEGIIAVLKFKQHKDNPGTPPCCAPPRELRHTLVLEFPEATLLGEVSQRNVRGKQVRRFSLSTVTPGGGQRLLEGVRGGTRKGGRVVWMKVPLDQLPGDSASRGVVTTALTLAGGKRTLRDAISFADVDLGR